MLTESWSTKKLAKLPRAMDRSGTVASRERIAVARARGVDVLPLQGSPRREPSRHVLEALREAAGQHPMYPAAGLEELRDAIAAKLQRDNKIAADPEQVLVTNGCKQALHVILASVLDPGDEVVYPIPAYVYGGSIELVGGVPRPVLMDEAEGYRWDPERLERAITPRTKVLLLNTPVNPTGFVAGPDDLRAVAALAERHDLLVLVDESHERFVFDGRPHLSLAALPEAAGRTVTAFSMSKAHNLMGHRVGYAVGPRPIIDCAAKVLEWAVLANNFMSQSAALAVLNGPQDWIDDMIANAEQNRDQISNAIDETDGISCVRPQGGTTHFINVRDLNMSGDQASDRLLFEYGVPTDPGRVFGEEGHVRLTAVGSEPEQVDEAIDRIQRACKAFMSGR